MSTLLDRLSCARDVRASRRWLFALMPLAVALLALLFYHSTYQTMDDLAMRTALDGTAFEYGGKRMPYVVYMNPLYGYLLVFLYSLLPRLYWYDVFQYALSIGSCAVLAYLASYVVQDIKDRIACIAVFASFMAILILYPQFTMTAGCLSCAAAFSMVHILACAQRGAHVSPWLYAAAALFAVFSSLIRFECYALLLLFCGLLLAPTWMPLLRPANLRKTWLAIAFSVGSVAFTFALKTAGDFLVSSNPEWNEIAEYNKARVEITDKTDMWDHIDAPWRNLETDGVEKIMEACNYSRGDYRLLLSGFLAGNKARNNAKVLKEVSRSIKDVVQEKNHCFAFRLTDYFRLFGPLAVAFVCLCLTYGIRIKWWGGYCGVLFVFSVCLLNMFFRALPERLWLTLSFAAFASVAWMPKSGCDGDGRDCRAPARVGGLLSSLAIVGLAVAMLVGVEHVGERSSGAYAQLRRLRRELKKHSLSEGAKEHVYFADYAVCNILCRPFSCYAPSKFGLPLIGTLPLVISRETDRQLLKYGISPTNTIEDICREGSAARFLLTVHTCMQPFEATMKAIGFYLGQKGFPAVAYFKPIEESMTYEVKVVREYPKLLEEWKAHCSAIKPECDGSFNWDVERGRFLSTHMHGCTVQQIQDVASRLRSCVVIDDNYKVK